MENSHETLTSDPGKALASSHPHIRKQALHTLIKNGLGASFHKDIMLLAQEDEDAEVRYLARRALNSFNQINRADLDSARNLIKKLLLNTGEKRKEVYTRIFASDDSFMKVELLRQLSKDKEALNNKKEIADLIRLQISKDQEKNLIPSYIIALGIFGTFRDLRLLQKYLQSPNPRIVANAIEALAKLEDPMAMNMVVELLNHEDNRVRANAITLIHKFDPERAQEEIRKISLSEKLWMRSSAIYCLVRLDIPKKVQIAGSMVEKEHDPELLNSLIQLLLSIGDLRSVQSLARRSVREQNRQVLTSIDGALRILCQNLQLEMEELKRDAEQELSSESKTEVSNDPVLSMEEPKRSKREKNTTKKTPFIPLFLLAGSLSFIFLLMRLGWDTGVVQKSYPLDPFTMKQAISADQYLSYLKAEFLRGKGNCSDALVEYDSLLKQKKDYTPFLRGKGLCLVSENQYTEARYFLEKVAHKNPRDPVVFRALLGIYLLQKESSEVILTTFKKALNVSPKDTKLRRDFEKYKDGLKRQ